MSSFVIDRAEYIKAAGFIAGLQRSIQENERHYIYMWNSEKSCLMTDDDFKKRFTKAFECNAISVVNQYGSLDMLGDYGTKETAEERKIFNDYKKLGNRAKYDIELLKKGLYQLSDLAACFKYQTEKKDLQEWGNIWFNECIAAALDMLSGFYNNNNNWGYFKLEI